MKKILLLLTLCFATLSYGQLKFERGTKFEFDTSAEEDAKFVLKDNYNTYLFTVINIDGMLATHQMMLRKFDQKNQLLDTYTYDFPKFDPNNTLYKYLGSAETASGKVVAFTKTYSNKSKKYEIAKHEFDKATAKFTSTAIESGPIASLTKSGDISLQKSPSGNYIGIINRKHREKGQPEKTTVTMIDGATMNVVWQKEVTNASESTTQNVTVTNSGKAVLLRSVRSMKRSNSRDNLVIVSADGEEEKQFEAQIFLQQPTAVSIGAQDYLIAFNSEFMGMRQTEFSQILFYDLQQGKTLSNTKVSEYTPIKGLNDVYLTNILLQNNEIQIFTEGKVKKGTKPGPGMTGSSFPVDVFTFGPSYLYTLSFEGAHKSTVRLMANENLQADLFHSYGLMNIKGNTYLNTGNHSGLYLLDPVKNPKNDILLVNLYHEDPDYSMVTYVNQLVHYFPDNGRLILASITGENEMALVNVTGVKL